MFSSDPQNHLIDRFCDSGMHLTYRTQSWVSKILCPFPKLLVCGLKLPLTKLRAGGRDWAGNHQTSRPGRQLSVLEGQAIPVSFPTQDMKLDSKPGLCLTICTQRVWNQGCPGSASSLLDPSAGKWSSWLHFQMPLGLLSYLQALGTHESQDSQTSPPVATCPQHGPCSREEMD